jgi:hypothetical protein
LQAAGAGTAAAWFASCAAAVPKFGAKAAALSFVSSWPLRLATVQEQARARTAAALAAARALQCAPLAAVLRSLYAKSSSSSSSSGSSGIKGDNGSRSVSAALLRACEAAADGSGSAPFLDAEGAGKEGWSALLDVCGGLSAAAAEFESLAAAGERAASAQGAPLLSLSARVCRRQPPLPLCHASFWFIFLLWQDTPLLVRVKGL